jgi:hypothetical protein
MNEALKATSRGAYKLLLNNIRIFFIQDGWLGSIKIVIFQLCEDELWIYSGKFVT